MNLTLKRATVEANPGIEAADLVAALTAQGYTAHELDATTLAGTQSDRAGRDLLMRLGVAGFAMMNVMLLSVAVWSGAADATRDLFHLDQRQHRDPDNRVFRPAVLSQRIGRAARCATEYGRADLAGDPAGGGSVDL